MKKQVVSLAFVLLFCLSLPAYAFAGNARMGIKSSETEVLEVQFGGPADRGGMKAGDMMLAIDGTEISTYEEFTSLLDQYNPNDTAVFTVLRDGEETELSITFDDREKPFIVLPDVGDKTEGLSAEEAYQAMVDAYRKGDYEESYIYYTAAEGYMDADQYGNLLKARLVGDWMPDAEIEALEKQIAEDVSFEDAADVLVCNNNIAHFYLLGYWTAKNGMYSFEVKPGDNRWCTYWRYDNWEDRVGQWDFRPISEKQMEIYAYQTDQSFTFTKIR